MKKFKKVFAVLLTLAMVLGMSMTTLAAPPTSYESDIKVTGLSSQEAETVNLYAAITLNTDRNAWVVAEWAKDYITLSSDGKKYEITDAAGLSGAVSATTTPYQQIHAVGQTEVTFTDVPVGAYVITASGNKITYAPMVAETYVESDTYMNAEDVTVVAKATSYDLTKQQKVEAGGNRFIARGEIVTFEVTTTFPSFTNSSANKTFRITDTPTGLDINTDSTVVKIGTGTVEASKYTISKDSTTGVVTIDLSGLIGDSNENAGKTVVVTYTAVVTADDGYTNTANSTNGGSSEVKGYTGDITLTKYAENGTTVLEGAEFKLYKGTKDAVKADDSTIEALYFVKKVDGEYKLAKSSETGATQTLVATNGTLKVTGLDEGDYWFEETKAPEGYSINTDGVPANIVASETANVSLTASLTDTKLSALPSTGGIGTTIFTIGGCAIMIAAAAMFFASRRKNK